MKLSELDWTRVRDLLASQQPVTAILPCGATEAHGPHLPLATDVIISEGVARRAVNDLKTRGYMAIILPSLAYAPADCAAAFPGTISISAETARLTIIDIADNLLRQGFACLGLVNSHFDPANVAMLREAARAVAATGLRVAFPDFTRRRLAERLTEEFVSGACHAGQFETSLIIADRPDLVDEAVRMKLPDNPASLVTAFANGATNFEDAGGPEAYFGSPAKATEAEGENSYALMAAMLVETVIEQLQT